MNPYEMIAENLKDSLKIEFMEEEVDEDAVAALRDVIMYVNWKAFNQKLSQHMAKMAESDMLAGK